jgi:DNA-binding transcriptional MerR regulator
MTMTVNDLAIGAGVPAHVVRYYTRAGLLRPGRDQNNHYRLYRDGDVTRLIFIRRAKVLGFTLADIGQILRDADRRRSPCPKTRRIILSRLEESEQRLSALVALQGRMRRAIRIWRKLPDAVPDGESICHLIEAVTKNEDLDLALK